MHHPVSDGNNGHLGGSETGRWLPLREALRGVGSLERLYRLAMADQLPSREGADGQTLVWITADRATPAAPEQSPDRAGIREASTLADHEPPAEGDRVTPLVEHLVQAHGRSLELAQENGALAERTASLERELRVVRDAAASDRRALERHVQLACEHAALRERAEGLERELHVLCERAQADGQAIEWATATLRSLEGAHSALQQVVADLGQPRQRRSTARGGWWPRIPVWFFVIALLLLNLVLAHRWFVP
jgi:hypothetical protein